MTPVSQTVSGSFPRGQGPPDGRVLLLSELFPPAVGGSAVLLHGIYSRLPTAEVTVLADGPAGGCPEQQGTVRVIRWPLATARWGVLDRGALRKHLGTARQVRSLARQGSVVHCARALPEGVAAMLARLVGGAPYIIWAHGEDIASALSSRELTLLTRAVVRGAAGIVANSRNTADLVRRMGAVNGKVRVVHPAVDAGRFHPGVQGDSVRERFAGTGDTVLLSVGRLQRRKGHDTAIEAVAALRHEIPGLRYIVAGDGEERDRLEKMVDTQGIRDRVFFAGVIPDAELPAYYAASDIFLLPNRIHEGDIEGFGIVFLEAAAAGKPVIGGDSGGVPEAVERDVTGLLVDGSVPQVISAVRRLAASEELRRGMGHAGRERAVLGFNWERAAAAVAELQRQVVSSRKR